MTTRRSWIACIPAALLVVLLTDLLDPKLRGVHGAGREA